MCSSLLRLILISVILVSHHRKLVWHLPFTTELQKEHSRDAGMEDRKAAFEAHVCLCLNRVSLIAGESEKMKGYREHSPQQKGRERKTVERKQLHLFDWVWLEAVHMVLAGKERRGASARWSDLFRHSYPKGISMELLYFPPASKKCIDMDWIQNFFLWFAFKCSIQTLL